MLEQAWWLWGAALPLVAAAVVMIVCLQPWRPPSAIRMAIAWPLALSLGYIVGSVVFLAIKHSLAWPPVEATDYLAMVLLPVAVLVEVVGAIVASCAPVIRWVGRALVIAATPPLMLLPFIKNDWSVGQSVGWCGGLAVAMAVVWFLMDRVQKIRPSPQPSPSEGRGGLVGSERESLSPLLALMIASVGVGATILTSGSVTLGQLGLTLASAIFGAWLVGVFSPRPIAQHSGGGIAVAVVLLAGLLINGGFYAEVKSWHAGVLVLAPLAAWIGRVPVIRKWRRWQVGLIVAAATMLVVAIAVVPAVMAAVRAMSESGYE